MTPEPEIRCTLPSTIAGLKSIMVVTKSLRYAGYKTRLAERVIHGFPVLSVVATPPARPSRKERGCSL